MWNHPSVFRVYPLKHPINHNSNWKIALCEKNLFKLLLAKLCCKSPLQICQCLSQVSRTELSHSVPKVNFCLIRGLFLSTRLSFCMKLCSHFMTHLSPFFAAVSTAERSYFHPVHPLCLPCPCPPLPNLSPYLTFFHSQDFWLNFSTPNRDKLCGDSILKC